MNAAPSSEPLALSPLPARRDRGPGEDAGSRARSAPLGGVADARARFAVNAASNLAYFAVNTLVMLWYVPFLVRHLGVAAYGMIPLANSLAMYALVVSDSLNASVYRYLAIDLNRGDRAAGGRTFNSSLVLTALGCAGLAAPFAVVAWNFGAIFNVPAGLEGAAQFLFACMGFATLVALLGSPFGVSSLVAHRFDLRNLVRGLALAVRVGLVAACFLIWPGSLWHVGVGLVASALVGLACDVLVWRRLTPELRIRPREADLGSVRSLARLGTWSAVNTAGMLLLMQVDLVIVNAVFGAEATGRYGSILLMVALVHAGAEVVTPMVSSAVMAYYAAGDREGLRRLAARSIKLLGVGLALPIGLLCGLGEPLLALWLGPAFADLHVVLVLLVAHLTFNLALRPLAFVMTACEKVKVQGLVTIALGLVNIALAVALARWSGLGIAGVAAAAALVWTVKNVGFLAIYGAAVLGARWWTFCTPLLPGLAGMLGVALAGRLILEAWRPQTWLDLAGVGAAIATAYGLAALAVLVDRSDRGLLWRMVRRT